MKWENIKLGDIAVTKGGSTDPRKSPNQLFDLYSIPAYDTGVPQATVGSDIGSSKKNVKPRDILLSRIVPHIRRAWIVKDKSASPQIASGEWIIFRSDKIVPEFLRHYLISDPFHAQFMQTVSGVGGSLLRARPSQVYDIFLPLPFKNGKPDLEEQKRIAAILDKADAIRRKRRQAIQLTDDFLRSLCLDMFGDPVTNPKGWPTVKFTEVGKFISGGTPSKQRDDFWNGEIPWVSPKDMKRPYLCDSIDHVSKQAFEETNLKIIKPDHVLIVVRGMILAHSFPTAINEVEVSINQDMKAIMPRDDIKTEFLKACFDVMKLKLLAHVSTAAHGTKRVDFAEMEKVKIPVPSAELQGLFVSTLLQIKEMSSKHVDQLKTSSNLFASLQQRAFKGEL